MQQLNIFKVLLAAAGLAGLTWLAASHAQRLELASIVLAYLLLVVISSYWMPAAMAVITACIAFFCIDYYFITPLHTFSVADLSAWLTLLSFLLVSLVITTLTRRLRGQTAQAIAGQQQAEFSRKLAEHLAQESSVDTMLLSSCQLLAAHFHTEMGVARFSERQYTVQQATGPLHAVEAAAMQWAAESGRMLGAGTENWPENTAWIMPFSRIPSQDPLLVGNALAAMDTASLMQDLRTYTDQIANAYQRLIHRDEAQLAALASREEALRNSLLASISHDMRTPLTTILGAATTMIDQYDVLAENDRRQLLQSITAEARHMATSTENLLSLVAIESSAGLYAHMDWQLPEELVGLAIARYRLRAGSEQLAVDIAAPGQLLIKADANLITQALSNLLDNALAVQKGSEPLIIAVREDGQKVWMQVLDNGPGFPAGFTAGDIRKFGRQGKSRGFGLGLSIVQTIANLHQAQLVFGARTHGGSSVSLVFDTAYPQATKGIHG